MLDNSIGIKSAPPCRLKRCELTQFVFEELGSVLRSGSSQLKSLIVGINKVGDQGVKHLWDAVAHPSCLLEELEWVDRNIELHNT